jgi:hypothetical protein
MCVTRREYVLVARAPHPCPAQSHTSNPVVSHGEVYLSKMSRLFTQHKHFLQNLPENEPPAPPMALPQA